MDVNVRDVEEIVRFGRSLQSFVSDYLGVVNQIGQAAQQDYTTARNRYDTIKTYTESAERDLKAAERALESTIDDANRNPDEDWSSQIEFRERAVEEASMKYARNKQALKEAEGIIRKVKVNTDMVWEQVTRSRKQIQDTSHTTLSSIKKAAQAIIQYKK